MVQEDFKRWPCKHTHAALTAAYPIGNDEQTRLSVRQFNRDWNIGWSVWTWARLQTAHGHNAAYLYYFDIHGPERPHGAPHATEYPYFFGNFAEPPSAQQRSTSELIRRYLINFATRGDPNGPGVPDWRKFEPESQHAMVFDEASSSRPLPTLDGLKALDAYASCDVTVDPEWSRRRPPPSSSAESQ